MPIWKLQTSVWADSVLARDACIIDPVFNDQGAGSDPQGLCDDLADALMPYFTPAMQRQIQVKAYDVQGSQPVYPQGSAIRVVGNAPPSTMPREVALCLSFYATRNIPRQRGRVYLPAGLLWNSADVRPTLTQREKVGALAQIFQDLGGVDVDWSVYSTVDGVARPVTNWWVDDEWDTIRSRGLRATTRTVGTTSEG